MIIEQQPTIRRNSRVAEIRIAQPQLATMGYKAFEAIADMPLYKDAPWSASRVPALTPRTFLQSLGQRPGPHSEVLFPTGLTERTASLLVDRGWQVTVLGDSQVQCFSPSTPLPEALRRCDGRTYALMQVPDPSERLRVVATLRKLFPDAHLLIVTKNKSEARLLAGKLRRATGLPVTWGSGTRTSYPWTHVDGVGTFTGRSVQDWNFVVFWDAELVLSLTSLSQILHMFGSCRFGFLTGDERKLNELDRALVESVFGPVVYRPGDEHSEFTAISVAWLPAASYPACQPENQLERKRQHVWLNALRNRLIAAAGRAFSQNDERALARMGLHDAAQWLSGRELGLVQVSAKPPTVAVVVENLEHARKLKRLLPGWRVASENNITGPAPLVGGNVIITLPLAARIILTNDVVLYVAGCGAAWFDELGVACAGITAERMLVVDLADDFDRKAVQEAEARRADYGRRGWTTKTSEL